MKQEYKQIYIIPEERGWYVGYVDHLNQTDKVYACWTWNQVINSIQGVLPDSECPKQLPKNYKNKTAGIKICSFGYILELKRYAVAGQKSIICRTFSEVISDLSDFIINDEDPKPFETD